jgi:hypothetical protein
MDRAQAAGVGVSVVFHAALIGLLALGVSRAVAPPPPPASMEVSFVEEVGLTSAAPEPTAEAPAIGTAPELGPPEDAATTAVPAPAPPAPPVPVARQQAAPPERVRPTPAPPSPQAGTGQRTTRRLTGDILRGIGDDHVSTSNRPPAAMTGAARASVQAAIRRALVPCERQPLPAPEAAAIKVNVRVALNRNGSLASAEVTRVINDNAALSMYERRMRDLALAIVYRCTPIRGLPDELYDVPQGWRQFTYQFDPRQTR